MRTFTGTKGTYSLSVELGKGGNGQVWRASGPEGDVAVKVLTRIRSEPQARFSREIHALRILDDVPGVLSLLDCSNEEDPTQWYAMPLATPLLERLGGSPNLRDICIAFRGLALALSRVHERGLAHRDIKPSNLYWHADQWCIGDFGLVQMPHIESITQDGDKLGPAHYIAPEMLNQAASSPGGPADVYSLGKTLWVVATGQKYPLPGPHDPTFPPMKIGAFRNDPRSAALDQLLRTMTELDPVRRLSAAAVANELDVLCREKDTTPLPDSASALERLRAALTPHVTREEEEERQQELAQQVLAPLRAELESIVEEITSATSLTSEHWLDLPKVWAVREARATGLVTWTEEGGYAFRAGGQVENWQLGIGFRAQLLSDHTLAVHAGYWFDRFIHDNKSNTMPGPQQWRGNGSSPNGTPSSGKTVDDLTRGLRHHLPAMLDTFAKLVSESYG